MLTKDILVNYLTSRNKYIEDSEVNELCDKVDKLEAYLNKNRGLCVFANGITSINGEVTYMLGRVSRKGELLLFSQYGMSINTDSKHTRAIRNKMMYSEAKLFRQNMPLDLNQINSYIIPDSIKNTYDFSGWQRTNSNYHCLQSLINRLNSD